MAKKQEQIKAPVRGGFIPPVKGERRGGRQKGSPNKTTAQLKIYAQRYGADAVDALAIIGGVLKPDAKRFPSVKPGETGATKTTALRELLDRGYGKPTQPISKDEDNPFELLLRSLDGLTNGLPSEYKVH